MDDVVNRMARELSDAIAAAVAEDPRVEACRERARAAGYEMKLSLEAVIGFMNRTTSGALAKISAPPQNGPRVVSVTSHGACPGGTGVPWKMDAEAISAAASMLTILA